MPFYYTKNGRIDGVVELTATDDEDRISQAREIFAKSNLRRKTDGFEVWDGDRLIYRFPEIDEN